MKNKYNIWLADDDDISRLLMKSILNKSYSPLNLIEFFDGNQLEKGLLDIKNGIIRPFDMLITDNHMPGKKGIFLIEEYSQFIASPMILWTGDYEQIKDKAINVGAFACIPKPSIIEEYQRVFDEVLKKH